MGLADLTWNNFKLPLYDLATVAAGFYIGYSEGKGIETSQTTEYLTKFGPTAFSLVVTPAMFKLINILEKSANKAVAKMPCLERTNSLDSKLKNQNYLRPTLQVGFRTATETTLGYFAGRAFSQFY